MRVQKKLREKDLPHKLVIVGKRSWAAKAEMRELSREIASGNVVCPGYVDRNDLPYVYRMADVFVFPSLYEGFGFPPLEAMACGTPVISSRSGSLAETLSDAAIIVEPHNTEQIVQAIYSMITNSSVREKYAQMGLERSSMFNWDSAAEQTLSVYKEVATNVRQR